MKTHKRIKNNYKGNLCKQVFSTIIAGILNSINPVKEQEYINKKR